MIVVNGTPLDHDPRRLEAPSRWPGGQSGPWRAAPLTVPAKHAAWLCWEDLPDLQNGA